MKGHAEIAGGGIGGLSSATMLAQQGWTVRVHERSPEIREVGTGIYIKNNAIEVLEEFGIFDRLVAHGTRSSSARKCSIATVASCRIALSWVGSRVHVFLRQTLIEVLRDAAERAGVDIVTGSTALAADPKGELLLEDGRRLHADLVIAADGVRSRVREFAGDRRQQSNAADQRQSVPDTVTRNHSGAGHQGALVGPLPHRHHAVR